MDGKTRLVGRNASPPAARPAPRSSEKDAKRSVLDSVKKKFKKAYFPDLILNSQVKVFSRLRGLKGAASTLKSVGDGGQIKSPFVHSMLASSPTSTASQPDHHPSSSVETGPQYPRSVDSAVEEPMHPLSAASQKRKPTQEHDDAPSRTKAKSRPVADDLRKRYIVQEWVNQQDEPVSPKALRLSGTGDSVPLSLTPPIMDDNDVLDSLRQDLLLSLLPRGAGNQDGSTTASRSEPRAVTSSPQPGKNDERRSSTATSTNMTYRDSIFSCPSVATGLTSPSEISLVLAAGQRVHIASRSSSFFCKPSPRSSIASNAPYPQFILYRSPSANSAGRFDEAHDLAQNPLPNLPMVDPLRMHPTLFGMDLENAQNAVVIDQVVKMGHSAQERRVNKKPLFDAAQLLVAPAASAPNELAPITETASDDGASSGRKLELHDQEPIRTRGCTTPPPKGKEPMESEFVSRSGPATPESTDRLSDTVATKGKASQITTPATSVTQVSDMTMREVASPQSEESDDSLSDITDYTEESLFETVEGFGAGLSTPLMLSIILTFKEDVIRLVLSRVTAMLGDTNGTAPHDNGENSGSSAGPSFSNDSLQNQASASRRHHSRKRELKDNRDGSDEDDGDDRGKRPKPTAAMPSDLEMRYRKLACPFFKRYPEIKWNRACCSPGFPTVHRIK